MKLRKRQSLIIIVNKSSIDKCFSCDNMHKNDKTGKGHQIIAIPSKGGVAKPCSKVSFTETMIDRLPKMNQFALIDFGRACYSPGTFLFCPVGSPISGDKPKNEKQLEKK